MGRSGMSLIREYVYYWVSGIFIAVAVFALYQQREANKLLAEIKIEMSNKSVGDTLNEKNHVDFRDVRGGN